MTIGQSLTLLPIALSSLVDCSASQDFSTTKHIKCLYILSSPAKPRPDRLNRDCTVYHCRGSNWHSTHKEIIIIIIIIIREFPLPSL